MAKIIQLYKNFFFFGKQKFSFISRKASFFLKKLIFSNNKSETKNIISFVYLNEFQFFLTKLQIESTDEC